MKKNMALIKIMLLVIGIVVLLVPFAITVHETSHWLFSLASPYTNPVGFHVLDLESFERGCGGFVEMKWSYTNARYDIPGYYDVLDEGLATFVGLSFQFITALYMSWFVVTKYNMFFGFQLNKGEVVYAQAV